MANFKRKKCRRQVACFHCTLVRWTGNSRSKGLTMTGRRKAKEYAAIDAALREVTEA